MCDTVKTSSWDYFFLTPYYVMLWAYIFNRNVLSYLLYKKWKFKYKIGCFLGKPQYYNIWGHNVILSRIQHIENTTLYCATKCVMSRAYSLVLHTTLWNGKVLDLACKLDSCVMPNHYNFVGKARKALPGQNNLDIATQL